MPRSFEFVVNALIHNLFRKIMYFILFSSQFEKFVKPVKMLLRCPFEKENGSNFTLFHSCLTESSDNVSKIFHDVTKTAWIMCFHMATVGNKGLN